MVGGVVLGCVAICSIRPGTQPVAFDAGVWKAWAYESRALPNALGIAPSIRHRMVDDLIANHVHVGMPKETLVALLGDPTNSRATADGEYFDYLVDAVERGRGDLDLVVLAVVARDGRICGVWKLDF